MAQSLSFTWRINFFFFSKDTWCFHGAGEVLFNILHQELKGCEGHKSTRTPQKAAFKHLASPLLLHKYGDLLRCLWTPWNFLYLCINIVSNIQILTPLTCLNSNNCNSVEWWVFHSRLDEFLPTPLYRTPSTVGCRWVSSQRHFCLINPVRTKSALICNPKNRKDLKLVVGP